MDTTTAIVVEASSALARARAYTVTSQAHYEAAADELGALKGIATRMEKLRKFLKEPVLEMAKRVDDLFREPAMQLTQAEGAIKQAMLGYVEAQKKIAAEESRRAHEALVEQRRREAEAAKAAELAAQAQVLPALGDDFDDGADDFAPAATVPAPVTAPVVVPPIPELPKAKGISVRSTWRARVTDVRAVVKAAAEGNELAMQLLSVDEKLLGQLAKSRSGALSIPGIQTFEEGSITAQAR